MGAIRDVLRESYESAPKGRWLVVFPASGTAARLDGAFVAFKIGGMAHVFVLKKDLSATLIDPRARVFNDRTLVVMWEPRHHLHELEGEMVAWFRRNPDTFNPNTGNGINPIPVNCDSDE